MTETEWTQAQSPEWLLKWLDGQAGERKLRLFAVACCRGLHHPLFEHRDWMEVISRIERGIEEGKDFVKLGEEVTQQVWKVVDERQTLQDPDECDAGQAVYSAADGISLAAHPDKDAGISYLFRVLEMVDRFSDAVGYAASAEMEWTEAVRKVQMRQAGLVRDIFGNPLRPVTLAPAHRTPSVVSLAQATYEARQLPSGELDPHRLAVLADALEESGAPGEIVAHLRGPGPHVRGCFPVDLCLGLS